MNGLAKRVSVGLALSLGLPIGEYSEPLSVWLADNPDYRLAVDKDCACEFVIKHNRREIGENYTPYRASGDFDGDLIDDIALVVVNKNISKDFKILVFSSRFANGKKPFVYANMFGDKDLGGIGLATERSKGRDLLLFGTLNAEGAVIIPIPDQVPQY